jgi:autotransporter-associated beta strand protein
MKTTSKIRLMLVDDHFVVRAGLAGSLALDPAIEIVAECGNGEQALPAYRQHRPDVVLMDWRLPGISGVEASAAIRAEFPAARIITLTVFEGEEDIHRAVAAGVNGYLPKTASRMELLAAIHTVHRGTQTIGNRILLGNSTAAITSLGTPTAANPALTGSGTLTKTGNGVLQLNSSGAASPFTGAINITGGSVRISGADALDGMANNRVTVAPGGAIDYQVQLTAARLDKVASLPAGAVERWSFNSPRVSTATPNTVPPGAILQIASDQTFAAGRSITLSEGSVLEPFTSASNASQIAGRYSLNTIPVILAGNVLLGHSGVLSGLPGTNGAGTATGSITGGPEIRHIGAISGLFGVTKQGADTYTLGSAGNLSTYTGLTNITGGTLRLNVTNAIKPGNDITVDSPGNPFGYFSTGAGVNVTHTGATPGLDLAGFSQTIGTLNGSGTIGNLYGTLPGVLTVAGGTFSGIISEAPALATDLNAQFGGTTALVKTGPGTLILTGVNTYSGGTTISGGVLAINSDSALGLPGSGELAIPAITNAGTGYTSVPAVTVTGGDGSGATATALMGGLTARVVLAGSGYATHPRSRFPAAAAVACGPPPCLAPEPPPAPSPPSLSRPPALVIPPFRTLPSPAVMRSRSLPPTECAASASPAAPATSPVRPSLPSPPLPPAPRLRPPLALPGC